MKHFYFTVLVSLFCVCSFYSLAQDVGQLKNQIKKLNPKNLLKDKSIKVSGEITAKNIFYSAWGIENRQIPFNYLYSGNLNVSIFGKINMPVSFSFANQNASFQQGIGDSFQNLWNRRPRFAQPINRMLMKPSYKGATLYLGTISLSFSPYTLAGHRFDGFGFEYKSEKIPVYGALMMGNLFRATPIDSMFSGTVNRPSFRRSGMGMKLGYKHEKDKVEMIVFSAKDIYNSLPYSLDVLAISPQSNTVFAFNGTKLIYKKVLFNAEVAISGLTTDQRSEYRVSSGLQSYAGLLAVNNSTVYKNAIKCKKNYRSSSSNGIKTK